MPVDTPFMRILAVVFGGSLAVQLFAFLRQLVIASAFGVERAMDLYLLVLSVAMVTSFAMGTVVENAAVPFLAARKEAKDERGFSEIANRVFVLSLAMAAASVVMFALAVPLFARFVATGLSAQDRSGMSWLIVWFLPWVAVAIPYYAVGSLHKAAGNFRRFMTAEVVVTLVSLAVIWFWRRSVEAIAVAYAAGYVAGLLVMLPRSGLSFRARPFLGGGGRGIRRQLVRLIATNQMSTFGVLADRFLISQTPPGVIAAGSYATLISGQIGALLGFRDAFMLPLSSEGGRALKLERILIGLLMLAIPIAVFLWWQAEPIVSLLLERGRFDRGAVAMTALMLSFYAVALPASTIMLPMYRTLQILDRMRYSAYLLLANAAVLFVAGVVLVVVLDNGVPGYLSAVVASAYVGLAIVIAQLKWAGIALRWTRILRYAAFALSASAAGAAAGALAAPAAPPWLALLAAACVFGAVYLAFCLAIRSRLLGIIREVRQA